MIERSPRAVAAFFLVLAAVAGGALGAAERPNIVLLTVDTLRADRVSALGYERPTTPNIDRLLHGGVNFVEARTVEPLTGPAMASMLTSLPPHIHGGTRNGLRIRRGLPSLPRVLENHAYSTAAFVGNWTLRHKLSGLGEHFETYEEVLTRPRWYGFIRREATAEDLTRAVVDWVDEHTSSTRRPFLVWAHYVEPHAPYKLQRDHVDMLGEAGPGGYTKADRYDTEVAFVDAAIGELLSRLASMSPARRTLIVFASDHGESLGEHGYWGHGRNLYEPGLRIPMGIYWSGRIEPRVVSAPALTSDVPSTVLGLLRIAAPDGLTGYDWAPVLEGSQPAPDDRRTHHEAHRGAVLAKHESEQARRAGLLSVASLYRGRKEILPAKSGRCLAFDLGADPLERAPLPACAGGASGPLRAWLGVVEQGLAARDEELLPEPLDEDAIAELRSLGYVD